MLEDLTLLLVSMWRHTCSDESVTTLSLLIQNNTAVLDRDHNRNLLEYKERHFISNVCQLLSTRDWNPAENFAYACEYSLSFGFIIVIRTLFKTLLVRIVWLMIVWFLPRYMTVFVSNLSHVISLSKYFDRMTILAIRKRS